MTTTVGGSARPAARFTGRYLAWIIWALALGLSALGLALLALNGDASVGDRWGPPAFPAILAVMFGTVGALIASRRPGNLIGWLFCWVGLLSGVQISTDQYAVYALVTRPGSLPGGVWFGWLQSWIWALGAVPAWTFLPLMFPHGRLKSPRLRAAAVVGLFGILLMVVSQAIRPGPVMNFAIVDNPLGHGRNLRLMDGAWTASYAVVAIVTMIAAVSLVRRLRHSTGETRAQLKWFAYAIAFLAIAVPVGDSTGKPGELLLIAATAGVPISVGIAILRYRLYDIDLIIRRTLVYSVLTGLLALLYFGGVALIQNVFRLATGEGSQLAVVASTLAIAAAFTPLRRWVQNLIDRRFYRRKYDAAQTLAEFAATARDETDLDRLAGRLVGVVEETVQPEQVGLWLKPDAGPRGLTVADGSQ